jgi:hypothetical protein
MAAHFFYSRITLVRISKSKVQISITTKSHLSEITSFSSKWILTKLGTYLVLKRIWNPIDFQSQRSRSPGQIFRRGDTPRFALFSLDLVSMINKQDF